MIGAIKHQAMSVSGVHQIRFYTSFLEFGLLEGDLKILSNGQVYMFNRLCPTSFKREDWTEEEALRQVTNFPWFKAVSEANFYIFYKLEKL